MRNMMFYKTIKKKMFLLTILVTLFIDVIFPKTNEPFKLLKYTVTRYSNSAKLFNLIRKPLYVVPMSITVFLIENNLFAGILYFQENK